MHQQQSTLKNNLYPYKGNTFFDGPISLQAPSILGRFNSTVRSLHLFRVCLISCKKAGKATNTAPYRKLCSVTKTPSKQVK